MISPSGHKGLHYFKIEERQRVLITRDNQRRRTFSRTKNRIPATTSDVYQTAAVDHREAAALATIALSTGEQVVLPSERLLGIEVLGPDMLDLVANRVLAVAAPAST